MLLVPNCCNTPGAKTERCWWPKSRDIDTVALFCSQKCCQLVMWIFSVALFDTLHWGPWFVLNSLTDHWDHKTWVNSTCDSISLRSTECNVVTSKWHSSQLDKLAKSCMFGQFCFYGSLCPDGALYSRIQERVTSEVEGVVNYKHHSSKRGFSYSPPTPLLLEDYLSCLKESLLQVSALKSGTSGHLQSPTLGLQPYVLSSSILSQGPCFALKK